MVSESDSSQNGHLRWMKEDSPWDGKGERKDQSLLRASRIIQLVHLISSRPKHWTRSMLAETLGVSERQITKDFDIIKDGLKFELKHERPGGYYFTSVPQLPAVSYPLPEAMALVLAAESTRQLAGFPQQDLTQAMARLTAIMPAELQALLDRGRRPVAPSNPHREEMILTFFKAIARQRAVDIVYRAASHDGKEQQRRVDPYEIISYGYSYHLLGWCHLRREIRDFKIDRIERAIVSSQTFVRDPDFDLDTFFTQGWGMMRGTGSEAEEVELLFSSRAGRWVAEERWHPRQICDWLPDGRLRFQVTVPITDELRRWVLRYGTDCRVVEPASLRDWVLDQSRGLIQAYAD